MENRGISLKNTSDLDEEEVKNVSITNPSSLQFKDGPNSLIANLKKVLYVLYGKSFAETLCLLL